jgi:hypothetical protein
VAGVLVRAFRVYRHQARRTESRDEALEVADRRVARGVVVHKGHTVRVNLRREPATARLSEVATST